MSGDQLDLDAIEARARHWDHLIRDEPDTTLALVAEVRRLRRRLPSKHCGCGWCCSNNADSVIPGDAHLVCARYAEVAP